jgi:toxin ParE1/3/4
VAKQKAARRVVLSPAARQDIRELLLWSLAKFGVDAAARYRELMIQASRDLEADPMRPGSRPRPELDESTRTYHLALSRSSVEGKRVKAPRHFILYRISPSRLEVARILHDSRDLVRHLPHDYLADKP